MRLACSSTSSGVIECTSTLPPASAKEGSAACREAARGPVADVSNWVYSLSSMLAKSVRGPGGFPTGCSRLPGV